tara:strand:+ start:430 stop:705 length:276 start_codon:yes stop_codon:yes gene_type:complete
MEGTAEKTNEFSSDGNNCLMAPLRDLKMLESSVQTLLRSPGIVDHPGWQTRLAKSQLLTDFGPLHIAPGSLDQNMPASGATRFGNRARFVA